MRTETSPHSKKVINENWNLSPISSQIYNENRAAELRLLAMRLNGGKKASSSDAGGLAPFNSGGLIWSAKAGDNTSDFLRNVLNSDANLTESVSLLHQSSMEK